MNTKLEVLSFGKAREQIEIDIHLNWDLSCRMSRNKQKLEVLSFEKAWDEIERDIETRRGRYCCTWPRISPIN